MKKLLLLVAVAAVAVPAASAGGWATVGLSSLPPVGLGPGKVAGRHHRAPARPDAARGRRRSSDRDDGGKVVDTFTATPTGKTGVYHADVTFPGEGTYAYEV